MAVSGELVACSKPLTNLETGSLRKESERCSNGGRQHANMNETQPKLVTPELLEGLKTPKGQWRYRDLVAIGVPMPLRKGWKQRIIGKPIKAAPGAQGMLVGA